MKTFLSLLSLLSVAGLLFASGCASENQQGGSSDSMESRQGQSDSSHFAPDPSDRGDYWGRSFDNVQP